MDSGIMMTRKKKMSRIIGTLVLVLGVISIMACENQVNPKGKGTPPTKTALLTKIDEAQKLLDSLVISTKNGTDVDVDQLWVDSTHILDVALEAARDIAGKSNATDEEIQSALEQLTTAYKKIDEEKKKGAKGEPNSVDKSVLDAKITEAEALAASLKTSADGNNISSDKEWVTDAVKSRLTDAIQAAKDITNDNNAAESAVDAALEELVAAYDAANSAKQPGTKEPETAPQPTIPVDKSALVAKIAEANALLNSLKASFSGSDSNPEKYGDDILPHEEWVTNNFKYLLTIARDAAQDVVDDDNALEADVTSKLATLIATYNDAYNAKKWGHDPGKDALLAKIDEAVAKMKVEGKDVQRSDQGDGSEHKSDVYWVASTFYNGLQTALVTAEYVYNNETATKKDVDPVLDELIAALNKFEPVPGTSQADKGALNNLISQVDGKLTSVKVSVDGNDVYSNEEWVTSAEKNTLQAVWDQAVGIAGNRLAEQAEVDAITTTLGAAFNVFNPRSGRKVVSGFGLDIKFNQPGDETITLSGNQTLSWTQNGQITITVIETFDTYQWYVDGAIKNGETGKSITLQARNLSVKTYIVTLRVTKGGVPYTKRLTFTVVD